MLASCKRRNDNVRCTRLYLYSYLWAGRGGSTHGEFFGQTHVCGVTSHATLIGRRFVMGKELFCSRYIVAAVCLGKKQARKRESVVIDPSAVIPGNHFPCRKTVSLLFIERGCLRRHIVDISRDPADKLKIKRVIY